MITIGTGLRQLTPKTLETRLLGRRLYRKHPPHWADKSSNVFIDLSRVEWVDVGALVQLVLFVEAAIREGSQVSLALPLARPRESEADWVRKSQVIQGAEQIKQRVSRRDAARRFLETLQLEEALSLKHLPSKDRKRMKIIRGWDSSIEEVADRVDEASPVSDEQFEAYRKLYKFAFPLRWFSSEQNLERDRLATFLARVLGQPGRGLEEIDAGTLSHVVLYELIQNVTEHAAGSGHALVAAWARPSEFPPSPRNYRECERPYLEWIRQRRSPLLDIVVGDSGAGLPTVLQTAYEEASRRGDRVPTGGPTEDANVAAWSFNRWSTSKESNQVSRGTRGLYRVDRIARKYDGMLSIRASDVLVGLDHGGSGYDRSFFSQTRLASVPGTVLRVFLSPFSEAASPRPVLRQEVDEGTSVTRFVPNVSFGTEGLDKRAREVVMRQLRSTPSETATCLALSLGQEANSHREVEAVLRELVALRHPPAMVVALVSGGWDLIENVIESLNTYHARFRRGSEEEAPTQFEVWNPVLVMGPGGNLGWVGASAPVRKVLDALSKAPDRKLSPEDLEKVLTDGRVIGSTLRTLRADPHLVKQEPDGTLTLLVDCDAVIAHMEDVLRRYVFDGSPGVTVGPFVTPSLRVVERWVEASTVLGQTCGVELAAVALARKLSTSAQLKNWGPANFLLSDANSDRGIVAALRATLQTPRMESIETSSNIDRTVRLIPRDSRVVVFSDLISSGESMRRCVAEVLRHDAHPLAIACIFDARQDSSSDVEMWGLNVPVFSLTAIGGTRAIEGVGRSTPRINPITRHIETFESRVEPKYAVPKERLKTLIARDSALYFSHIGRPVGRHFTFYLDATRLSKEGEIVDAFDSVITNWCGRGPTEEPSRSEDRVVLWYPSPEPKLPAPARRFALELYRRRADIAGFPKPIKRMAGLERWLFASVREDGLEAKNLLIIDWGALAGTTVMELIRKGADAGAERILACIFLSQISWEQEAFLRSIDVVQGRRRKRVGQEELPFASELTDPAEASRGRITGGSEPATDEMSLVSVKVKFLSSIRFGAYDKGECPVCEQLKRLAQEKYPTTFLEEFAGTHEDRLKLRSREEVLSSACSVGEPSGEGEATIWMVSFRSSLEDGLTSTSARLDLLEQLKSLGRGPAISKDRQQKVLWLMRFLQIEAQWFRQPPLNFLPFRERISSLAISVCKDAGASERDRIAAAVVLRTASKLRFASALREIVRTSLGSEQLMAQLLYGCFTYISRPYIERTEALRPLQEGLAGILEDQRKVEIGLLPQVVETVKTLLAHSRYKTAKDRVKNLTVVESWRELYERLVVSYRPHDSEPEGLARMKPGPDAGIIEAAIERGDEDPPCQLKEWLLALERNWRPTEAFLDRTILPLVGRLRDIIEGSDGQRELGWEGSRHLMGLVDLGEPLERWSFSKLVRKISSEPSLIMNQRNWNRYVTELEFLWQYMLMPRSGEDEGPARLITFIEGMQTKLREIVDELVSEAPRELRNCSFEVDRESLETPNLFVPRALMRDALWAAMRNVQDHRVPEGEPKALIRAQVQESLVVVSILNSDTIPTEKRGEGIELIRKRLSPFGGEISADSRPAEEWTSWVTKISVQRI